MAKVNKVNPGKDETKKQDKEGNEKEKGRIEFPIQGTRYRNAEGQIVTAVNSEGLLIAVPKPIKDDEGKKVLYTGFDVRKHLPLKKNDFASFATFMYYQAFIARCKAVILIKSAEEKEAKASRIEKFGDENTRKKVQKIARMRDQLAALEKQLEADGVDVSNLT